MDQAKDLIMFSLGEKPINRLASLQWKIDPFCSVNMDNRNYNIGLRGGILMK